jgi:dimethylargininase
MTAVPPHQGIALVREPSPRLAEGLVTHIPRTPVDVERARRQHKEYVSALRSSGWDVRYAPPADECPDSVFVEDTVVVCGSLAVLARPGTPSRIPEVAGTEQAVRELGLRVARIEQPGTLDGGDVLQVGTTVYVGLGGRTNAEGIRQLRDLLAPEGRDVVDVPLGAVLHLKSALTKLPDDSLLALPELLDPSRLPALRAVDERPGCHLVLLGGDRVLIAASAPHTTALLEQEGLTPVVVDISEFEKLEASVTCLSVLIPAS